MGLAWLKFAVASLLGVLGGVPNFEDLTSTIIKFQIMESEKKISHFELTSTPASKSCLTPSEFPFKEAHSNAPPPFPFNFAKRHFITDQFLSFWNKSSNFRFVSCSLDPTTHSGNYESEFHQQQSDWLKNLWKLWIWELVVGSDEQDN